MTDTATLPRTLRLHPRDNVLIAIDALAEGAPLDGGLTARARIPKGHKVAAQPIAEGAPILKFGQIIGAATRAIAPGEWVHEHNSGMLEFARDHDSRDAVRPVELVPEQERRTFQGYRRANGRAGTRNYIGIATSVNCSATVARFIAEEVNRSGILDAYPNVDGVVALVHGTGCGMTSKGEAYDMVQRTLWGYASHANFGGMLLVGLGCEVLQVSRLKTHYGLSEGPLFRSMTIQDSGGTRKTVAAGVEQIKEMLPQVNACRREPIPVSELIVGLQCGGSDGYSGITANPALGAAADLLVRHGGTAILSETPEIYGAEHLLTRRAVSPEVADRLVERLHWWEGYTSQSGGEMNNNPSPGNKAGGLTTILEKSLGAVAKGGTSPLAAVYEYAEPVTERGFVFMDTPGYDPVSATGQVAGGANLLCFTTGRGSAFGCKPSPSIKLATNSDVYARMTDDMDINCGDILDGVSIEEKGREIFERIIAVASGEKTKSEELGYGGNEFVPWQIGATM
ncbi:altronate dehydratase family protein [Azospirillum sp. SYSU D00513]|uniref:UxaA family hydrolase n=1 Tax=Azospirillum sp. SYSU D00513 TaxID=2812561 RepID=UPI001A972F0D|nr:altronate dehydratase family protein [Azospirillum sp. SYSU D00513]